MPRRSEPLDGFWLPSSLSNALSGANWEVQDLAAGRFAEPGEGISVRWPRLRPEQWSALLHDLDTGRGTASAGLVPRWQRALSAIPEVLMGDRGRLEAVAEPGAWTNLEPLVGPGSCSKSSCASLIPLSTFAPQSAAA